MFEPTQALFAAICLLDGWGMTPNLIHFRGLGYMDQEVYCSGTGGLGYIPIIPTISYVSRQMHQLPYNEYHHCHHTNTSSLSYAYFVHQRAIGLAVVHELVSC